MINITHRPNTKYIHNIMKNEYVNEMRSKNNKRKNEVKKKEKANDLQSKTSINEKKIY